MRGIELTADKEKLTKISGIINNFKDRDYKVILGSILEAKEREFYSGNKFSFSREEITRKLLPAAE